MADLVDIWSSHSPNEDMVAHVARFEHGYPVNDQFANLKMAIDIVSFPMKHYSFP